MEAARQRYGSEASGKEKKPTRTFFDRYESITKKEYENAVSRDIPVYVLVEDNVYSEYQTYLRNKDSQKISYAHVDSANIFRLIEEILARPRNNPVHTFEKFSDIESWLTEQWAGLFRELLQKQSQQQQLSTLSSQVTDLRAINETLRKYLEALMRGIRPDDSSRLIQSEQKRLQEVERAEKLKSNPWARHVQTRYGVEFEDFYKAIISARSFSDFAKLISRHAKDPNTEEDCLRILHNFDAARHDFNVARGVLGLKHFRQSRARDDKTHPTKAVTETKSSRTSISETKPAK